jgi:membrane protein DedA with SNARE-associated domain
MLDLRSKRARRIGAAICLLALLPAGWFGVRSYRSFLLVVSAYELGAPEISNVRPWMTIKYAAEAFRVPADALMARLGLPPTVAPDTVLKTIAEQRGLSPFAFTQEVQRAIAEISPARAPPANGRPEPTPGDDILSAILVYGYPALALALLLGAMGAPLPTGFATIMAGSLAAKGSMNWLAAGAIAVAASILGDAIAYGAGRALGREFVERRGRWFGVTPARWARVQHLFERWGGLTVLVTRTLVSHLSSIASLLAGIGAYRLTGFIAFALLGRILWTAAYLGVGYAIGSNLETATEFLKNLTGFIVFLLFVVIAAPVALGRVPGAKRPAG